MDENSSNLVNDQKGQIQKAKQTPNKMNSIKPCPDNKLLKLKDKEKKKNPL